MVVLLDGSLRENTDFDFKLLHLHSADHALPRMPHGVQHAHGDVPTHVLSGAWFGLGRQFRRCTEAQISAATEGHPKTALRRLWREDDNTASPPPQDNVAPNAPATYVERRLWQSSESVRTSGAVQATAPACSRLAWSVAQRQPTVILAPDWICVHLLNARPEGVPVSRVRLVHRVSQLFLRTPARLTLIPESVLQLPGAHTHMTQIVLVLLRHIREVSAAIGGTNLEHLPAMLLPAIHRGTESLRTAPTDLVRENL